VKEERNSKATKLARDSERDVPLALRTVAAVLRDIAEHTTTQEEGDTDENHRRGGIAPGTAENR